MQCNLLCCSDDPDTLAWILKDYAGRLDAVRAPPTQIGIQMLQIGTDPEAAEALRALDDDLKGQGVRDMVDTTLYEGRIDADFILKALLGAINRRIDSS